MDCNSIIDTEENSDIKENYEENSDIKENYEENSDIKENYDDTEENSDIKQNDDDTKEQDIKENDVAAEDHKNYTDTKESKGEETVYSECENYLKKREYPTDATKLEKAVIQKRAKNFEIVDGILHYGGKI